MVDDFLGCDVVLDAGQTLADIQNGDDLHNSIVADVNPANDNVGLVEAPGSPVTPLAPFTPAALGTLAPVTTTQVMPVVNAYQLIVELEQPIEISPACQ